MPKLNAVNLTETFLTRSIQIPHSGRIEIYDAKAAGLHLRVSASGNKSWAVHYRLAGRKRKFTIGKYPEYSLEEARSKSLEIRRKAHEGINPVEERRQEREALAEKLSSKHSITDSVEDLSHSFLERYVVPNLRPKTARDYRSHFDRYILPSWRGRSVKDIRRSDVAELLDAVQDKTPIQSNRVQSTISKWFNWLVNERGVLEYNPIGGMKKRSKENVKSRVLTDDEIRHIWLASDNIGWPFGFIVRVLLLTAKRRAEVAGMRWSEIDLEQNIWVIPGGPSGRTKNKKTDVVPLSDSMLNLIERLPRHAGTDLVFPAKGQPEKPFSGFSKAKTNLDILLNEAATIPNWTLHDLRRTARSSFSGLGILKEVAEKILNHVDRSIDGIHYDHYDYLEEKRTALQKWADHLGNIVNSHPINLSQER
jgi:integrase